ncbi:MAG: S24/S26 family peptidase, partial [Oscillospiraceae bacterium]|nr:S24/S26 family peptidase [Candidatus Equicaccousia limihippi]
MIQEQNIEQMLDSMGVCVTGFSGVSMMPMLNKNTDRILITKPPKSLSVGDIVLYKRDDVYVLHRILKICGDNLIIRGDNCVVTETQYKSGDIIGILDGFWRNGCFIKCTKEYSNKFFRKANRTYFLRKLR